MSGTSEKTDKMIGVSVIIPYHNDVEDLRETLESLYDTMRIEPWQVIVQAEMAAISSEGSVSR